MTRASDDLTLKNEFEPEPKTGNDCPQDAEARTVETSDGVAGRENRGVCNF